MAVYLSLGGEMKKKTKQKTTPIFRMEEGGLSKYPGCCNSMWKLFLVCCD